MTRDVREAIRRLLAKPGFSLVAVLTLAIGIGANTAVFGAVRALLVRPLPVPQADRVVHGLALREGFDPFATSLLEYAAYRDRGRAFESSGVSRQRFFTLTTLDPPERVQGAVVTSGFLTALGVEPAAGRSLTADDDRPNAPPVAVIGYGLWQRLFNGDRSAIGAPLHLDAGTYTIVGVMPRGFDIPSRVSLWVPQQIVLETLPLPDRASTAYTMVARLGSGVTLEQADAEVKAIARRLEDEYPQYRRGWSYRLIPLRQYLLSDLTGSNRLALLTLSAAVGCLLLICCANVANLFLVRGIAREREVAVRLALGASRWHIVRHVFAETGAITIVGAAAGVLVAAWATPVLAALNPIRADALAVVLTDFHFDASTWTFATAMAVATGLLFGALPAFRAGRARDVVPVLRQRDRRAVAGSSRWLGTLVVAEVAIACVLLVNGSLIVRSFARLQRVDFGFDLDRLLTVQLSLPADKYQQHASRMSFVDRLVSRVEQLPGVKSAGVTTNIPLQHSSIDSTYVVEGRPPTNPNDVPITAHRLVTPAYLQTLGVRLVKGRLLDERDREGSLPVVVITEELARQAWRNADPLGRRIRRGRPQDTTFPWLTVVGVVADVKEDRFNFRINRAAWYLPYAQQVSAAPLNLLVRTTGDPIALAEAVRAAIRAIDSQQAVSDVTTMTEQLGDLLVTERFSAVLMTTLALVGLFLAACGLYGVIAYTVGERTREIGLRMALGATSGHVVRLVMGKGFVLVAVGLAGGCVLARAGASALSATLYGVTASDPATFVVVALVLGIVSAAASYAPARRATAIDPLQALNIE